MINKKKKHGWHFFPIWRTVWDPYFFLFMGSLCDQFSNLSKVLYDFKKLWNDFKAIILFPFWMLPQHSELVKFILNHVTRRKNEWKPFGHLSLFNEFGLCFVLYFVVRQFLFSSVVTDITEKTSIYVYTTK